MCVTGASGFLASHVVAALLARGYHVRGTVRDLEDPERTAHLRAAAEGQPGTLELTRASLLDAGSYHGAVADCDAVLHMASPLLMHARDPQREIVDPALHGTDNVFDAVEAAPSVRRVVMTSSIAAIRDETLPPEHVLTEADWNETASLEHSPYPLAKTEAERRAWARARAMADSGRPLSLVTINPTIVFGPALAPAHGRGSLALAVELLRGRFPGTPRLSIALVDVRDVARAHVEALERPEAAGRYITFNRSLWMREMADLLRPHFPERRLPRRRLPDWMMYVAAMFDRRISWSYLRSHLGVERRIDAGKSERELGLVLTPIEDTILDTARSLIDLGLA